MDRSIYQLIRSYINSEPVRFHVPSHKGKGDGLVSKAFDLTELGFTDNIIEPKGNWLLEEEKLTNIFSTKATLISLNGATAGVIAAITSLLKEGNQIIIGADSHISCYYGIMHSGARYTAAMLDSPYCGPSLESFKAAFAKAPKSKVAFITSPSYYGVQRDLASIIDFFHQNGVLVICDEAHGAHFMFAEGYPSSSLSLGADIVIHSAYKTINGPTQTAFLHINNKSLDVEKTRKWLCTVHTTSPSYPLALDAIKAAHDLKTMQNQFDKLKKWYNHIAEKIEKIGFLLVNKEEAKKNTATYFDFMKIPVDFSNIGITGRKASDYLERHYNIYSEMADSAMVLFCAGVNSSDRDFERLIEALPTVPRGPINAKAFLKPPICEPIMPMRQAMQEEWETVSISSAIGRISADFFGAYPPGAPIAAPGSLISKEAAEYIMEIPKMSCFGVSNQGIKAVKQ